ncbi:alpha/beta fold hydrolase [Sphingomonas floccifaciens]|uniref:Alpha/beta fold hydrolase n=1 Tax=Sphingomonas floccifaciens TaxID=1844115 RepID=A0ABW4N9V4_9SPHN
MLTALLALLLQATAPNQPSPAPQAPAPAKTWPTREADYVAKAHRFTGGRTMDVRMHYTTLGQPHRNATGEIDNAVLILHGTGGTGKQFLNPIFADELYGPGQPFDITRYWIILPDNIGHGASSKPSDGMRAAFPDYGYTDMVALQHRLVTEALGVKRLRLIFGTSMGCMHAFVWGETYPDAAAALMPMACEPVQIAGLNRMWRQMAIDAVKADPTYAGGNYSTQPMQGLRTASSLLIVAGAAPLALQKTYPTRDAATAYVRDRLARDMATRDANDMIYQLDASRDYDPWSKLEAITAPVLWINSADDFINPRGLPFPEQAVKRMRRATFRMIPESETTRGHGTHTAASFWKADLAAFLARTR